MERDYKKSIWVDGSEPDIDAQHLNNIENGIDGLYKPVFDDGGKVTDVTDLPSFLSKVVSGMNPIAFYKNFKAGMAFVLHAGQLVNNGLCNIPGKYPLDAAYGKALLDLIGNVTELPSGATNVVAAIGKQNEKTDKNATAITTLNRDLDSKISSGDLDNHFLLYILKTDNFDDHTQTGYGWFNGYGGGNTGINNPAAIREGEGMFEVLAPVSDIVLQRWTINGYGIMIRQKTGSVWGKWTFIPWV